MAFINISLGYTDCIMLGRGVSEWQSVGLRLNEINVVCAKSILLTIVIVNIMITKKVLLFKVENIQECRRKNNIISLGGLILLYVILIYSFISQSYSFGKYESVTNPIFEYSLIILCFTWYYSKEMKWIDYGIWIYFFGFSINFLRIGDRSSVYMLVVLMAICYFYKLINVRTIGLVILVGIPITNFIAIFRDHLFSSFSDIIIQLVTRGLYVDTVSWAYYGSLAISMLYERVGSHLELIVGFWGRVIGIESQYSSLAIYARTNYSDLYNLGGGIYSSFFYAFGGYISVIIGAVILGIIIRKIMMSHRKYLPFKVLLIVYVFRWYLYDMTTLYRGVLIFVSLVYLVCLTIEQTVRHKIKC
ncbi:hypothetical protein [Mordavella massiliensis]|uniref:O-antigen polysaccharide polymerase Wzy n=1 Tax=Mordavella massiliensis TaxID=1871024 RepID=A0A938XFL6_9CLOT|nr:hypothetical protein [Mordavella massiliensis]MBM6949112.1 hypothetical protein [Mordavella massiliensis]